MLLIDVHLLLPFFHHCLHMRAPLPPPFQARSPSTRGLSAYIGKYETRQQSSFAPKGYTMGSGWGPFVEVLADRLAHDRECDRGVCCVPVECVLCASAIPLLAWLDMPLCVRLLLPLSRTMQPNPNLTLTLTLAATGPVNAHYNQLSKHCFLPQGLTYDHYLKVEQMDLWYLTLILMRTLTLLWSNAADGACSAGPAVPNPKSLTLPLYPNAKVRTVDLHAADGECSARPALEHLHRVAHEHARH